MSKPWRLEVTWRDSITLASGEWFLVSEIGARRKRDRCTSVGIVLADDRRGIVLANSVHNSEACGVVSIPRSAIVSRKRLR
jgi:hypothetical protein